MKAASVPGPYEAPPIVHSRPPRSPRSLVALRSQPAAGIRRSSLTPDEHFEIAYYLQREPSTTTRRAASVPPRSASLRPSVPRWFPSSAAYYGHHSYGVPATVPTGLPPLPPTTTHHLPTDTVVGVAHTSLYGDIVIGIPYKKRFMFQVWTVNQSITRWDVLLRTVCLIPIETRDICVHPRHVVSLFGGAGGAKDFSEGKRMGGLNF